MPRVAAARRVLASVRSAPDVFLEKDFYLEEFRGRSVLVAVTPAAAAARPDLHPLAGAVLELVRHDTRVLVCWPDVGPAAERRLKSALTRTSRRGGRRQLPPTLRINVAPLAGAASGALRAALWGALRRERLCVLVVHDAGAEGLPAGAVALATALGVPKLVLLDAGGGLVADGSARLSFVDENVLETVLREGQAEWSGLGDRRSLLVAVRAALGGGVEAVNLCTPEGVAEELFTYVGSGTLFTRGDYCHVTPLALDDFAQAERLLERGQREGFLKLRTPEESALVLAAGYGARLGDRHLAGVAALLTAPYAVERAGEIAGLYTITRFKGEGIGERLVGHLLGEAERRELAYVFACAVDERAVQFFVRLGFERVRPGDVPAAKWVGYDARRRVRLAVFRRPIAPSGA